MFRREGKPAMPSNLLSAGHSLATNLFGAGEDLIAVQKLARHSEASTTADLSLHKTEEQRRGAIRGQDDRIPAAAPSQDSQLIRIVSKGEQQQTV